ncbi:cytoskeleton-associated protein 5-like [Gigaspora margarita]|uniref:Cytoskeleton-associated protein 5-like n=1 Tax=Gigaspora margarita TaxID=4874 RepID=A0A8H3X4U8_GIGMA|nr:cytoskeleton-associated protein 5-like [Gigaspora margarita]
MMVSLKTSTNSSTISERDLNSKLTDIFTKIGQPGNAQQGIQELYDLLIEYPECDVKVNAFLATAGTFFQKYIRKALADLTTQEMRKCGMLPKEPITPIPTTKDTPSQKHLTIPKNNKPPHKFSTTRCSNSNNGVNTSPVKDLSIKNDSYETKSDVPPMTPRTRAFIDKTGQKRSSLPNLKQIENDSERLEFVKSIIRSRPKARRSTWNDFNTPFITRHTDVSIHAN